MTPRLPQTVRQPDSDWQGFLKLARHVSETIGTEFLSTLVHQLAAVLEANCVYIGEFVEGKNSRVRTVAEMQVLDLNPIVEADEQMLRQLIGENIELKTELAPSTAVVSGNAGCMHQMLLNLAVNARDAMPHGGRLTITLSNVDIGEIRPPRLNVVDPGPYVLLSVADNGLGMSPDVQEHLFEPFFTTKEGSKGTGLGLSTVYRIVRESRGQIIVETEPNMGTMFEIFLPRESP